MPNLLQYQHRSCASWASPTSTGILQDQIKHEQDYCSPCTRTPTTTDFLQHNIHRALQDGSVVEQISCQSHSQTHGSLALISWRAALRQLWCHLKESPYKLNQNHLLQFY
uniref:LRR-RLK n=1 Tax=Rhizophora mucronata TaxID=61149 RepID=A0A2P2MSY2_RHIMU